MHGRSETFCSEAVRNDVATLARVCGCLQEIMVNPVLASDGHTYELIAIQRWMEKSDRSPMTNMKLPSRVLTPNLEVRQKIQEWQEKQANRGR